MPPYLPVTPPTPQPTEFGLFSVATVRPLTDPHAEGGVQWEPTAEGTVGVVGPDCGDEFEMTPTAGMDTIYADPFTVWAGPGCDALLGYSPDDFLTRSRLVLSLSVETGVERALATGDPFPTGSLTPTLQSPATVLSQTAVNAKNAVGLLEQALGDAMGAKGAIHAPLRAVGHMWSQVDKAGARLTTKIGTPIAFGAGYTGQAPQPAEGETVPTLPNVVWVYATGPTLVTHTPPYEPGGSDVRLLVDRASGALTVITAQVATVSYEGPLFAVPLSLED